MHILDIKKETAQTGVVLSARVESRRAPTTDRLWFRFTHDFEHAVEPTGDPFLTALLPMAMRLGEPLTIDAPVDAHLLRALPQIMHVLNQWESRYRVVDVNAPSRPPSKPTPDDAVGCFFSGGVDSFYTLLKHSGDILRPTPPISHIIFVHGFDIGLNNLPLYYRAFQTVRRVGRAMNKQVVPVSTNVHPFTVQTVPWAIQHGAALASIVHCTPGLFRLIYVPATHTYADSFAWGSHPLLDPLWSTSRTQFLHDGCEATRVQKVAWQIAPSPIALRYVRVCYLEKEGEYNCGRCEKCMRTKLNLYVAGALDRCKTFDGRLTPADIGRILIDDENTAAFVRENLEALRKRPGEEAMIAAIERSLARWRCLKIPITAVRYARQSRWLRKPATFVARHARRLLERPRAAPPAPPSASDQPKPASR